MVTVRLYISHHVFVCFTFATRTSLKYRNAGSSTPVNTSVVQPLKQCENGSFCCGSPDPTVSMEATDCCAKNQGFFLDKGKVTLANASSSPALAPSSTESATVANTPAPSTPGSSHTGIEVGGVVAGVSGLLLLVAGSWLYLRRRNRQKLDVVDIKHLGQETVEDGRDDYRMDRLDGNGQLLVEKEANSIVEKDGSPLAGVKDNPVEKEGSGVREIDGNLLDRRNESPG